MCEGEHKDEYYRADCVHPWREEVLDVVCEEYEKRMNIIKQFALINRAKDVVCGGGHEKRMIIIDCIHPHKEIYKPSNPMKRNENVERMDENGDDNDDKTKILNGLIS